MHKVFKTASALLLVASMLPYLIPTRHKLTQLPAQPFPESTYLWIDGVQMHTRIWQPTAPLVGKVLLVHGFGGSTFSWRHNVEPLVSEGYFVVAADLPGFGYSDRAARDVAGHAERGALLWSLLTQIEMRYAHTDARWHLMGHSMGGGAVATMSVQEPKRTASLTVVAGALFSTTRRGHWLLGLPPVQRGFNVALVHVLATPANIERFLGSAYGRLPTADEIEGYLAPLRVVGTGNMLYGLARRSRHVPLESLAAEAFPVLAVWGEKDSWVPIAQGERLRQVVERTNFVEIQGAGHCPMETHFTEFNKLVLAFLRDADAKEVSPH
ncbi:MAG: alpha/beta fold hydrolase [Selenomonadales bacterium]|nr:alpha/beta fold hydrolase [Selenomonadales bacterium]